MTREGLENRERGSRGLVFDIQRFSVHDGPGIRTTVFMKGCPLRCLWCSNPESQAPHSNIMTRDVNCRRCGACRTRCPESAIRLDEEQGRTIDWDRCNQCLECATVCLYDALAVSGRYMEIDEIVDEIRRDEDFYRNSGGGVTVSGGEPLFQSGFVSRLMEICRSRGWHTALDTTGHAPWEHMESVLDFTDLILFDIKHLDSAEHRRGTGVGNEILLANLSRAAAMDPDRIWLRMPIIASYNDSEEHIERLAGLGRELGVDRICLLPYHEGGRSKCGQMGRAYPYPEGRAPGEERMKSLKGLLESRGLRVTLGR